MFKMGFYGPVKVPECLIMYIEQVTHRFDPTVVILRQKSVNVVSCLDMKHKRQTS